MSEEITTSENDQTQAGGQDAPQKEQTGENPPWLKDRLERAKESARKEVEAKYSDYEEVVSKAKQWDEQQEANKSELQKANEEKEKLEKQLSDMKHAAQVREWIDAAAAEHGVQASLLRGDTKEEINAHAQAIKDAMGQQSFAPTDVKAKPKDNGFVLDDARIRKIAGLRD